MPDVRIQFVFLQQTAPGRRTIAEAEQEQRTGSGRLNKKAQGGGRRDHVSAIPCSRRSSSSYDNVNVHTINSALHPSRIAKSSTSFGQGKGWNVTSAGWQVTLRDPIWHVSSSSGVATSVSELLYTSYFTLLYQHKITALFIGALVKHINHQVTAP